MGRKFDRFMVDTENGRNLKLSRFTDGEFRALVQGVWPIAAKADPRGAFMVGREPATPRDVVFQAPSVKLRTATSCVEKMRSLGMLEWDDELGGEWVHDWDVVNPAPRLDRTNAERQARYRERRNAVTNASRNEAVTPTEVEVEDKKTPPTPPGGVTKPTVRFAGKPVPKPRLDAAVAILTEFNRQAGTSYPPFTGSGKASDSLTRIIGALSNHPELTVERAALMIRSALAQPFWEGAPAVGVVFGPKVVERNLMGVVGRRVESAVERVARLNAANDQGGVA